MGDTLLEHAQTAQKPMFGAINPSNPEPGSKVLKNVSNAVQCSGPRLKVFSRKGFIPILRIFGHPNDDRTNGINPEENLNEQGGAGVFDGPILR
jgi:hypothetical protein